jgi:hypothetical protein
MQPVSLDPRVGVVHLVAEAANGDMVRVIVTLKGLEAGQVWAPRIADARERVLKALVGHKVTIDREYDLIPALALSVDGAALRILQSHPDVASVAQDGMSVPGGIGSTVR